LGYCQGVAETRRRRSNGEASRLRILDAAAQIAGERGYEGTSINLVSERSGLPASSIYWHFKDKDQLIAAVIDQSFQRWNEALSQPFAVPDGATEDEAFHMGLRHTGEALARFPDFLRLGLLLILEQRPQEPTARSRFMAARRETAASVAGLYQRTFPDLGRSAIGQLVTLTMALADGLFIAGDAGEVELDSAFDLLATAVLSTARALH
jgi:AcrR family transcriptional regulator